MNKREWMLQAALANMANPRPALNAVEHFSEMYDAICAATAPETGWVEHDGDVSKAPGDETLKVVVMFRSGDVGENYPEMFEWDHLGEPGDVVRWRYA